MVEIMRGRGKWCCGSWGAAARVLGKGRSVPKGSKRRCWRTVLVPPALKLAWFARQSCSQLALEVRAAYEWWYLFKGILTCVDLVAGLNGQDLIHSLTSD